MASMNESDIRRIVDELIQESLAAGGVVDRTALSDAVALEVAYRRPVDDESAIVGSGFVELKGADGRLKQLVPFGNLITQVGDQFYGDRAAAIGSIATVTGMRLGTGGETAAAKTGAGAAIVTYITASNKAIDATWPQSSLSGSSRRIQWKTTWNAGEATATGIDEWVITNETPLTNVAGTAANTISRAIDTTNPVNKAASDVLSITWNHDLLGA